MEIFLPFLSFGILFLFSEAALSLAGRFFGDPLNRRRHLLAIFFAAAVSSEFFLPVYFFGRPLSSWFWLAFLVVAGFLLLDLLDTLLDYYSKEIAPKTRTTIDEEILPIARNLVKFTGVVLLILFILSNLGVEIGPLLAGLGIGGLAVALALQDTLANFFSGLHILADRPVRVGDFIRIDDVEGTVIDIGWRSTRVLTPLNTIVVFPNRDLATKTIVNYSRPRKPTRHKFTFSVAYGTDVKKVKEICKEIFAQLIEEGVINKNPPPVARLSALADSGLEFVVVVTVPSYLQRFSAQERFLEEVYKRLTEEGIEIPFPTRTVYLRRE